MSVGIIVGSAFTAIVASLVNDVLSPVIGIIAGGVDFSSLKIVLSAAAGDSPEMAIMYGSFLQAIINFLIISFSVFSLVRLINRIRRKKDKPKPAPKPSEEVQLLTEIRDALKKDRV